MKFTDLIDIPFTFLMPSTTSNKKLASALSLYQKKSGYLYSALDYYPDEICQLFMTKNAYEFYVQRSFGLGIIASLIPGTKAFQLRKDVVVSSLELESFIFDKLAKNKELMLFEKTIHFLRTTPFFFLDQFFSKYSTVLRTANNNIMFSRKEQFIRLLLRLPVLSDIFTAETLGEATLNIIHTVINPVRLITSLLTFIHRTIDTTFEIGSSRRGPSNGLRIGLKSLSALLFLPLRLLSSTIEGCVDTGLNFLKHITLSPIAFLYQSIKQTITTFNKSTFLSTVEQLQGGKSVRRLINFAPEDERIVNKKANELYDVSGNSQNSNPYHDLTKFALFNRAGIGLPKRAPVVVITTSQKAKAIKENIIKYHSCKDSFFTADAVFDADKIQKFKNEFDQRNCDYYEAQPY